MSGLIKQMSYRILPGKDGARRKVKTVKPATKKKPAAKKKPSPKKKLYTKKK
jgi:hypothetical protein